MKSKYCLTCIFLLLLVQNYAQNMEAGYEFLDNGAYKNAEKYFSEILKDYPNNKTAKLCYGRSIGLQGKTEEAISIFKNLENSYPDDFEIKLNYGESLLWNKSYSEAEKYFENLVRKNPESFAVNLSYANTLTNVKKHKLAIQHIDKALAIQPNNENALRSKKYIQLSYAYDESQKNNTETAMDILESTLKQFPNDIAVIDAKANLQIKSKKYDAALKSYASIKEQKDGYLTAICGSSLVYHLQKKDKKAQETASIANVFAEKSLAVNTPKYIDAKERYIQALLWNFKYKEARKELEKISKAFPNSERIQVLQAMYNMYTNNFQKAIRNYDSVLRLNTESFDGNLGNANAHFAYGDLENAYAYNNRTLKIYPNQKDALQFNKKLTWKTLPFIKQRYTHTYDNGENKANAFNVMAKLPTSFKFSPILKYTNRKTTNAILEKKATTNQFELGAHYGIHPKFRLEGSLGLVNALHIENEFTSVIGHLKINFKPAPLQDIKILFSKELQNFNAPLIEENIMMYNYQIDYLLETNFNLGLFTQSIFTSQSDDNTRNILFASLFYKLSNIPAFKVGVNYQYMTFKETKADLYFSPNKFNSVEVFTNLTSPEEQKITYLINGALGYQYIEDEEKSGTFRIDANVGYRLSDYFHVYAFGKHNNIASATATGFEFTEYGFGLQWYFSKKTFFTIPTE